MMIVNQRWHFLTPYLSYHSPRVPAPRDYNVLLRVLQVKPDLDAAAKMKIDALPTSMRDDRVRMDVSLHTDHHRHL